MLEAGDKRKDCCKQSENLVPHQERPDLVIKVCKVCHCRHFEVTLDPGKLGLAGKEMG